MPIITLTTDFGISSPYVAQMKASIFSIAPLVNVVDITHAIPPQDITAGAIVLTDTALRFPQRTIHVAVIDPGVGSSRDLVAALVEGHWFIVPDNGLLTGVTAEHPPWAIRKLSNEAFWLTDVSKTFHGRDILGPVAAHLSTGINAEELGPPHEELQKIPWPWPNVVNGQLRGVVIYIDSFGNLITNIQWRDMESWQPAGDVFVECGDVSIQGVSIAYADQPAGSLVALFGSARRLEIAAVNGNAAAVTGIEVGQRITLRQ